MPDVQRAGDRRRGSVDRVDLRARSACGRTRRCRRPSTAPTTWPRDPRARPCPVRRPQALRSSLGTGRSGGVSHARILRSGRPVLTTSNWSGDDALLEEEPQRGQCSPLSRVCIRYFTAWVVPSVTVKISLARPRAPAPDAHRDDAGPRAARRCPPPPAGPRRTGRSRAGAAAGRGSCHRSTRRAGPWRGRGAAARRG